ncbi:MAG: 4'-phosphopantetheinyl transferase superfamily protein [Bacteroidota bacterium]
MVGIDIVDLNDPLLKERDQRMLNLVKNENDTIVDHPCLFWILWSAKEAIFKYHREPISFAPTKIPITLLKKGEVLTFESNNIKGKFEFGDEYLLAVCGDFNEVTYQIFSKKNNDWRSGIREMIVEFFNEKGKEYSVGADDLNLPIIEPAKSAISISHHGRFGAVAFSSSLI